MNYTLTFLDNTTIIVFYTGKTVIIDENANRSHRDR